MHLRQVELPPALAIPFNIFFDWGDGTNSDWLPEGATSASKTWTTGGVFTVSVRARCAIYTDIVSKWSNGLAVIIESVSAPTVLSGPTGGMPDQSYSYTASGAFSNAGHALEYQFDWKVMVVRISPLGVLAPNLRHGHKEESIRFGREPDVLLIQIPSQTGRMD